MNWKRILRIFLLAALSAYALLVGSITWAMYQPPEKFGRFMSRMPGIIFLLVPFETLWTHARAGSLRVGDTAPDFTLRTVHKTAQVTLSSFRGRKPVVLVFGSDTCPPSRREPPC